MKVLILTNNDIGLYKFRKELLERLNTDGYDVFVSLPNGEYVDDIKKMGCHYIETDVSRHGTNPFQDLKLLRKYNKILREVKPNIVFTYTIKPNIYGGIACAYKKIPYVANVTGLGNAIENGGLLQRVVKQLYKFGLRKAQKVFFQNLSNKALFEEWGIVRENAQIIPGSGVNLTYHAPAKYPDNDSNINFLFIGRIMKEKGIGELLEAMEQVHERYSNVMLHILGGLDGDYQHVIEAVNQLRYVSYHGSQADVRPFIRKAHCTVLPSYHEGTANVLLESAAAARPIIASRVPGCQETFVEGVSGLGCEVKNSVSLARAMIKFIELPYKEKVKMGLAGRKKMESEYDRTIVVDAYINEIKILK